MFRVNRLNEGLADLIEWKIKTIKATWMTRYNIVKFVQDEFHKYKQRITNNINNVFGMVLSKENIIG